jgi:hypothetical protein
MNGTYQILSHTNYVILTAEDINTVKKTHRNVTVFSKEVHLGNKHEI